LKATLAAVLGSIHQPDLLILDEPTNNLDIKSIGILENALNQYQGAILLISHDASFVKNFEIDKTFSLQRE
jgi:ATPase subunit of ABC transporter with duplicated ATPase domains